MINILIGQIYIYLKHVINFNSTSSNEDKDKKRVFSILVDPLYKIYKNHNFTPIIIYYAGKCLEGLLWSDIDLPNAEKLFNNKILETIENYIVNVDSKIQLSSVMIFNHIIPAFKDNLSEELNKHNKIFQTLMEDILCGPTIPGVSHSAKVLNI